MSNQAQHNGSVATAKCSRECSLLLLSDAMTCQQHLRYLVRKKLNLGGISSMLDVGGSQIHAREFLTAVSSCSMVNG